jgi:hypothetical protein
MNYQLTGGGDVFEYQLLIRTIDRKHLRALCDALLEKPEIFEFQLSAIAT